jgi:hypothetical protein
MTIAARLTHGSGLDGATSVYTRRKKLTLLAHDFNILAAAIQWRSARLSGFTCDHGRYDGWLKKARWLFDFESGLAVDRSPCSQDYQSAPMPGLTPCPCALFAGHAFILAGPSGSGPLGYTALAPPVVAVAWFALLHFANRHASAAD